MEVLKPLSSRSFLIGLGVAAAAYMLAPTLKQGARAVAVRGVQGAMMAGEAAGNALQTGKEKMSHMMQDMTHRGQDGSTLQQLMEEMRTERQQYASTLQELVSTMKGMQEEISALKANRVQ